jgi:hypothetical protein
VAVVRHRALGLIDRIDQLTQGLHRTRTEQRWRDTLQATGG